MSPSPPQPKTKSSSVPHWAIYLSCIGGALGLVVIASTVYLLLSRRNKDNTVIPWATGLSGQLSKAFVTGQSPFTSRLKCHVTSSEKCATD
jgi:hypothetical protein